MARHIHKNDLVTVISGGDAGKQGKVLRVIPDKQLVVVQGINVHRRNLKKSQQSPNGGVIQKELPLHWSNVAPVSDGKATRVRFEKKADGSKLRVGVKSGQPIGEPLKKAAK